MTDIYRIMGKINSEGGKVRVEQAGSGGLNLYVDRISPYDDKIIDKGHEYFLRGTKKDIYEALIKIRFIPQYRPYSVRANRRKKTRCWKGYKPVKGKRPYSKGSCRKVRKNKTKARPIPGMFYRVYFSHPERGETTALIFKGEQLRKLSISDLSRYWPLKEGLKMAKVHFSGPFESWDMAFMNR